MNATYCGALRNRYNNRVELEFEYRGHHYFVSDNHNGYMGSLREQHEYEQARIDNAINEEQKEHSGTDFFDLSVIDFLYE